VIVSVRKIESVSYVLLFVVNVITVLQCASLLVCVRLKYEKDLVVNLEYEKNKMTALCDQEAAQLNRLKEVLEIVKQYVFICFCESLSVAVLD